MIEINENENLIAALESVIEKIKKGSVRVISSEKTPVSPSVVYRPLTEGNYMKSDPEVFKYEFTVTGSFK